MIPPLLAYVLFVRAQNALTLPITNRFARFVNPLASYNPHRRDMPPEMHRSLVAPQRTKWAQRPKNGGENKCCSSCNRQPDRPVNGIEECESAGRLYQHELFASPGSSFLFRFHSRFLRPSRHRHSAVEGGQVVGLLGGDGLLPGVGQDVGHRGYSW